MTTHERTTQIRHVSNGILEFLDQKGSSVGAGTLIRDYCKKNDVDPTLAETALLLLLNEGSIITNRELRLERRSVEVA